MTGKTDSYLKHEKEVIERAIELARENTRKLQKPMPHTLRRKKRAERKGK